MGFWNPLTSIYKIYLELAIKCRFLTQSLQVKTTIFYNSHKTLKKVIFFIFNIFRFSFASFQSTSLRIAKARNFLESSSHQLRNTYRAFDLALIFHRKLTSCNYQVKFTHVKLTELIVRTRRKSSQGVNYENCEREENKKAPVRRTKCLERSRGSGKLVRFYLSKKKRWGLQAFRLFDVLSSKLLPIPPLVTQALTKSSYKLKYIFTFY